MNETHDERLVEREHDNKLDAQELGQRTAALQLLFREAEEHEQAVECDPGKYKNNAGVTSKMRTLY
jgi:hypothetical protein